MCALLITVCIIKTRCRIALHSRWMNTLVAITLKYDCHLRLIYLCKRKTFIIYIIYKLNTVNKINITFLLSTYYYTQQIYKYIFKYIYFKDGKNIA
jgi:hypothetical protein